MVCLTPSARGGVRLPFLHADLFLGRSGASGNAAPSRIRSHECPLWHLPDVGDGSAATVRGVGQRSSSYLTLLGRIIGPVSEALPTVVMLRAVWPLVTSADDRAPTSSVRVQLRIQPVDATDWLNISADVWKLRVFLGRLFNCLATALSLACE